MAALFTLLPVRAGSRLTHVWHSSQVRQDRAGNVATAHFVRLPDDQSVATEAEFLSNHLPFSVGGIGGVEADGSPWLLALQQSARFTDPPLSPEGERAVLDHAALRAQRVNPGSEVERLAVWDRRGLLDIYLAADVSPSLISLWSSTDLVLGLLAECCGTSLADSAMRFASGCALPGVLHHCQQDVFDDTFVAWLEGRITTG